MRGAGEQQGGVGRGRDAEPARVAQVAGARHELRHERPQPTEQAQAAADVGDHGIGRRETRKRREGQRPRGDLRERAGFGGLVAIAQGEIGSERERPRHELPVTDPRRLRSGIGHHDARIVSPAADDERTRGHRGVEPAREDVEGQRWEEETGPQCHGRMTWRRQACCGQMAASESPSSASSRARSGASLAQKNSSSCGGATRVPASMACACPR